MRADQRTLKSTMNYLWRLIATGVCFASFSLGGLILTYIVIPLTTLRYRDDSRRTEQSRRVIYKSFRLFIHQMSFLGVINFDLADAESKLSNQKGKVIIANHPSLIDVVVLISIVPHANCIIKEELWENRFVKGVLSAAGYIKNSGNVEQLISACSRSLAQGHSLIIFPEGTRTTPNQKMSLKRGASNIALRCAADLVPVLIRCQPTTLTRNERWYSIPPRKVNFSLRVGTPMEISNFQQQGQSLSVSARLLTAHIKDYFVKGLECYE